MKPILAAACAAAALMPPTAGAEVRQAAPDGFFIAFSETVDATPAVAYADIAKIGRWWDDRHTWSGKAANLELDAKAGGCFCERWSGGSAEHGRVVMALPGKLLRLDAALGPLQEYALKGILSFWIRTADDGATTLTLEYRVNGAAASGLDTIAPTVDGVLSTQFARLKRYIDSGRPDAPPDAKNAPPDAAPAAAEPPPTTDSAETAAAHREARRRILEEWKESAEAEQAARAAKKQGESGPGH